MKPTALLAAAWTLLAAAAAAPALAADPPVPAALFGSEAEAKGDFDAWYRELLGAVAADPSSPYASIAVEKVRALRDYARDPAQLEALLDPVHARGVRDPEMQELVADLLAARARARGEFERAETYGGDDGYVARFAVTGPFGWDDPVLVHRAYGPEQGALDPGAAYETDAGTVRWLALPQLGPSVWVSPYDQIRQHGVGVAYAVARVRSTTARDVALKVLCSQSFAVFVNGRAVTVADRGHDAVPNPVWCAARLEAGSNVLLVKLVGRGSFAIKLADAETGAPLRDVEVGDPLAAAPQPAAGPAPAERRYRTPYEQLDVLADGGDALRLAAAATALDDAGREWPAYERWEAAAASSATLPPAARANVLAAYGRFLAGFDPLPPVQRKLRARQAFQDALTAYPKHHSATLRLARYQDEDDHPDAAMRALTAYVADNPTALAWETIAEVAKGRSWEREAIEAAEQALALAPHAAGMQRFLAEYDRRYGNEQRYAERMQALLATDASDTDAADELIRSLRARGRDEEALATLRGLVARRPDWLGYRRQIAATLRALHRYDESLAIWRELEALVPEEEGYPEEIGELLDLQGDTQGALAAYRRSLALRGFQPNLWRAIQRITGESEDFAKRFEPDVEQILAELPDTETLRAQHPKAVAVTVLDHNVTRVLPDGAASSIVHMIYKLLDEKGVQKYDSLSNSGEVLLVRVIQPDGTVMMPTGLGGRSFNLEGLVPGSIIEHRFLMHQAAGRQGYEGGQFFFQDFEFRQNPNPVLLSRDVVVSDEGHELPVSKHNYAGDPAVVRFDGKVATIWEKRDMPRIEWEQGMPEKEEIVPYVDYSPPPRATDANWELLSRRDDSKGSPLLDARLAAITQPGMGDTAKLHAIYDFVNTEITGDFGVGSGPTAILLEKAGDRGQLFEAFVRAAGIPYRQGHAMAWRGENQDLTRPNSSLFGGSFLWLEPRDGAPVAFFMGARQAPFGVVPDPYRGSFAFLSSAEGGEIRLLEPGGPSTDNGATFRIQLGAQPEDTRVRGDVVYRSLSAYRFKRQLQQTPQDDRRKFAEGQMSGFFANPTLESYDLPGLDTRGRPLTISLVATMPQYLTRQGDRLVASLGLPESNMTGRFVHRPERVYDLVLNVRDDVVHEFTIELGDAFEVVKLPPDHVSVQALGTYSLTWRLSGTTIRVRRELHLQPARYSPERYADFVAWCKGIDDAEAAKLELRSVR